MKLCKDCIHVIRYAPDVGFSNCRNAPRSSDPVTGETRYFYCETERAALYWTAVLTGDCGKSGRYFEPKP